MTARRLDVRGSPESSVAMVVVEALAGAVERAGVTRERFLRASGIDSAQLRVPDARIARSKIYQMCELAMELTRDPALGLHWSEYMDMSHFAPVSYITTHAPTVREAFESLAQFNRLMTDEQRFELVEHHDQAILRVFLSGDTETTRRFVAEVVVSRFLHLLRKLCAGALPEFVSFEYPPPAHRQEYVRVLESEVRFEQPFTGIVFARACLDLPAPRRDDDLLEANKQVAQIRLQRMTQNVSYALRVREFLIRERRGRRTAMSVVAKALQLSVRSLRRRLETEGAPYGELANQAAAEVAKHLLRDDRKSIRETAQELGFESLSAFHRAFRRTTGTTPNAFRDAPDESSPEDY